MEFVIGVMGPKCLNGGATRRSKKFLDRFSRFDRIPAVTDGHPPSHPVSHVAVASTRYAIASRLKREKSRWGTKYLPSFSVSWNNHRRSTAVTPFGSHPSVYDVHLIGAYRLRDMVMYASRIICGCDDSDETVYTENSCRPSFVRHYIGDIFLCPERF